APRRPWPGNLPAWAADAGGACSPSESRDREMVATHQGGGHKAKGGVVHLRLSRPSISSLGPIRLPNHLPSAYARPRLPTKLIYFAPLALAEDVRIRYEEKNSSERISSAVPSGPEVGNDLDHFRVGPGAVKLWEDPRRYFHPA